MTDRKMKTLEDSFKIKPGEGIISNHDLIWAFNRIFHPAFQSKKEILYKVGDSPEPINFNISVLESPSEKGIHEINLPEFFRSALYQSQKYRIIHSGRIDGNYLIVKDIDPAKGGSYVIANDGSPKFIIGIEKQNRWIAGKIAIREHKGGSFFHYTPNLDQNPQAVKLETSVPLRSKGDREKLTKKLFLDFHYAIKSQYLEKGATEVGN